MALVRLQDVDWTLTDKKQDIRGRELRDAVGRTLGTIEHMIVDTDQERVILVRLTDATEYPADELQIMEDAVYFIPADVPASASPAPTMAPAEEVASIAPEGEGSASAETAPADPSIPAPEIVLPSEDPAVPAPPEAADPVALGGFDPETPAIAPPAIVEPTEMQAIPAPPPDASPAPAAGPRDVDEPAPAPAAEPQAPGAYLDADFRNHFDAEYDDRRLRFGDVQFAYRFGFDASRTPRLAERSLPDIEADLRRVFYARFNYPANDELVWAVVKDAVEYGFRLGKR